MPAALQFLSDYETWLYGLLAGLALIQFYRLWRASDRLGRTPFGLEKDNARAHLNGALAWLIGLVVVSVGVYLSVHLVGPALSRRLEAPAAVDRPTPIPSPTPVVETSSPLVVDSSGCDNPGLTLSVPQPNTQIAGSFEAVGTADIEKFAFYKVEISGPPTSGAWVTLIVGNVPVRDGSLGRFDSTAYGSGDYAFRLVVQDSEGLSPMPCVVPVSIRNLQPTLAP